MEPETLRALELAKESSDRSRSVLLFTQVACIIIFVAASHETSFGWTFTRLHMVQAAVWYIDCVDQKPVLDQSKHDNCYLVDGTEPFTPKQLAQGKQYLQYLKLTPEQAHRNLQNLQDSVVNRTMNVSAPLLGFTFDVNDLGLLGGLSLLFLVLWLYFSLRREEENVRTLFQGTWNDPSMVYRLASMTQVLTIPPEQNDRFARKFLLGAVLRLLYVTPLLVHGLVLWRDRASWAEGEAYGQVFVWSEFLIAVVLGVMILGCTVLCWRRKTSTDSRWEEAASRIAKVENPSDRSEPAMAVGET
jgi:hypothetical protein